MRRARFPHATLVAYTALFFALAGGSALAAHHYLITSKSQIAPKVRRALRAGAGARGATGPTGPAGAPGAAGPTGPTGTIGAQLASGKTETGVYFAEGSAAGSAALAAASISFPVPLASAPTPVLVSSGTTSHCQGSATNPTAAPGYLCVYVGVSTNVGVSGIYDPFGGNAGTASPYGAGIVIDSAAAGDFYSDGTWAVTAP
jgi:hypothetical protein